MLQGPAPNPCPEAGLKFGYKNQRNVYSTYKYLLTKNVKGFNSKVLRPSDTTC